MAAPALPRLRPQRGATTRTVRRSVPSGEPRAQAGRRPMRPRQAAVAGAVGLLLAALLNAVPLQRSAETSPYGMQRTVALALLSPVARLSHVLRLDRPRAALDSVLGHDGVDGGGPVVAAVPEALPAVPPTRVTAHLPVRGPAAAGAALDAEPAVATGMATAAPAGATPATAGPAPSAARPAWTADNPLRLWVGGDSVAGYLSYAMVDLANRSGVISAHAHFKISTGISRPDYYDWPAHLADDMRTYDPQVVIFLVGANDDQPLTDGGGYDDFGSPAWVAEYGRRVGAVMDSLTAAGRLVFWVGMPAMRSADFDAHMRIINSVVQDQASRRPDVTFVDSRPVMSDAGLGYTPYLPDASGQVTLMRAPDGIHLTPAGGERLATAVLAVVRTRWAQVDDPVVTATGGFRAS